MRFLSLKIPIANPFFVQQDTNSQPFLVGSIPTVNAFLFVCEYPHWDGFPALFL